MKQHAVFGKVSTWAVGFAMAIAISLMVPALAFADVGDQYIVDVDQGYLALRSAPAYDSSNEIGQLNNGEAVTVKRMDGGDYWWVYSPRYDKEGYVNKNYLVTVNSYGDYNVKVDSGYLALRSAPAYDASNEIGQLNTGDVVTVRNMENANYWWVYSPKLDSYGYVDKNYLTTEQPTYYGDYSVKVDKGYLALRTAPAYDASNEIGQLNTGDVVQVQEKRGNYWWVYSPKLNREGYVDRSYLIQQ